MALPSPAACRGEDDVGKLHRDDESGIWYECVFDERRDVYTWTALPPDDQ